MSNTKTGGPAFPEVRKARSLPGEKARLQRVSGMTLRDYFAGKAFIAACELEIGGHEYEQRVAQRAYVMADAMLAAREV